MKNIGWWITEGIIWFLFFYLIIFSCRNEVSISWASFFLVFLASLGLYANPLSRHLSIWNKILDRIVKKEEEREKY